MGKEGILEKEGKVKKWRRLLLVQAELRIISGKSRSISLQVTLLSSLSASLPSPSTFLHAKCIILPEARQAAFIIFHNTLHAFPFQNS